MKYLLLFVFIVISMAATAQDKINPGELLRQAELKRMPWNEMSLQATLADSSGNVPTIKKYHVYLQVDKALVVCTDPPIQKGNLLLLQKEDLWYYMKSTSRPMKITPLQRLSGAVSFVDVTRLNWSEDFTVDAIKTLRVGNRDEYILHLKAVSPKVSYRKIDLWMDKRTKQPLKEDIYLTSGKLYKTVLFTKYENVRGKDMNIQMEFIDHFNHDRKSMLSFSDVKQEKNLPADYFDKEKLPLISKTIN
jgi:outer membrane lipoprotein-sorting protein